ncbi:MAG: Lpg1974 family pore-forming outer membrane protein [Chlamydiota bacterium]
MDLKPAFSAPARINPSCGWDIAFEASFIYWNTSEEGLDFALYDDGETPVNNAGLIFQEFNFVPGFKLAAGSALGTDHWTGRIEYTRLHSSEDTKTFAPNTPNGILFPNNYATQVSINVVPLPALISQAKTRWECKLDVLDLETARWFYSGQMLTMGPFLGARGGWLDQNFDLSVMYDSETDFRRNMHKSKSWFIGPRAGLDMNWILGYGLRATGSIAGSLLYQRQKAEAKINPVGADEDVFGFFKNTYRHVRPNAELGLTLGWGTYLAQEAYHIDLAAGYEFHYWAKQNAMRTNIDAFYGEFSSPGDLMYHGLTVTAKFDF